MSVATTVWPQGWNRLLRGVFIKFNKLYVNIWHIFAFHIHTYFIYTLLYSVIRSELRLLKSNKSIFLLINLMLTPQIDLVCRCYLLANKHFHLSKSKLTAFENAYAPGIYNY